MKSCFYIVLFISLNCFGAISHEQYNLILDKIYSVYNPIYIKAGAKFVIKRNWSSDKVNAKARVEGSDWVIDMMGGYARHSATTSDGFSAFICHEIGHHFGGFPYWSKPIEWASAEGQADYFVTTKCLRRLWNDEDNLLKIQKKPISKTIINKCNSIYKNKHQASLCIRVANAGYEMLVPIAYRPDKLSVDTPNTWVTTFTFVSQHPGSQCRLDTLFQGALCDVDYEIDLGKEDESIGSCSKLKGDKVGIRPRCWFLPRRL